MLKNFIVIFLLATSVALFGAAAEDVSQPRTLKVLNWEDLMPDGEEELLQKMWEEQYQQSLSFGHSSEQDLNGVQAQFGTFNVVKALDGQQVRLPGFVVPLEYADDGKVHEFLLVPYFGACIHSPPPPPNQVVYVVSEKAHDIAQIWDPIWITGVMRTQKNVNDVGSAAYTVKLDGWEKYIDG